MSDFTLPNIGNHTHDGQAISNIQNRGYDTRVDQSDPDNISIGLMNIDEIIISYLTDVIKPQIKTNNITQNVPVVYGTAERWKMFRADGFLRAPGSDKALTPIIMIRRSNIERSMQNPVNKHLQTAWEVGWNKRNAYDRFAVVNGITPSRKFSTVIIPDYVTVNYDIVLWTEYEEQMSDLLGQLQVEFDDYWGVRNNFKFRVRVDSMESQSGIESAQDRIVRYQFSMKVSGYLIPERMIRDAKIVSTNQKTYTKKKTVVLVETEDAKIDVT